jgi:hypothetical protein
VLVTVYGVAGAALSRTAAGAALSSSAAGSSLAHLYGRAVSTVVPRGLHNLSPQIGKQSML